MSEASLYLIRHGHTTWNGPPVRMQGNRGESHLSERGQAEALTLGPRLPRFDRIVSSPLARCLETVDCIFARTPDATDPRLAEIDVGGFSGRFAEEIERSDPDGCRIWRELPPDGRIGGDGETVTEFQRRVVDGVLAMLDGVMPGERVLIATHGGCIRAMEAHVRGVRVAPFSTGGIANLGLFRVSRDADGVFAMTSATSEGPWRYPVGSNRNGST